MQFAMAAALCARRVGVREVTDEFVLRPEVQAIFPCVSLAATTATQAGTAFAPADSVQITTTTGDTLKSGPVEYAKGSHQRPLSRDELWVKFVDCLGAEFPDAKKSRAFENLMVLDRLQQCRRSRTFRLSMILSENWFPLFGIMLEQRIKRAAITCDLRSRPCRRD